MQMLAEGGRWTGSGSFYSLWSTGPRCSGQVIGSQNNTQTTVQHTEPSPDIYGQAISSINNMEIFLGYIMIHNVYCDISFN